jgi:hypothetical protein
MGKARFVHEEHALEDLRCNLPCIVLTQSTIVFEVCFQIAMSAVFCGNKQLVAFWAFVPALQFYKVITVLGRQSL